MPKVRFTGYITPSGFLPKAGRENMSPQDPELPGVRIGCRITDSRFVADCELDNADLNSVNRLHMWVYHLVRQNLDIIGFVHGIGLTLIVETCTMPDADPRPIHAIDRTVADFCTLTIEEIIKITEPDPRILKHIHDLAYCLSHPLEIPVNCARAVEGISKLIAPDAKTEQHWLALRENLNLTRDYVQLISDVSTDPRHGGMKPISLPQLYKVRNRSWTIVNRFLHFMKLGNARLPREGFPLL